MQLFKLFAVPLFIFKFEEHHKYVFSDIDKIDNTPQGWKLSLNSTFPSIPDDDQLVPKNIRDNLIKDLGNQISSNLSEYNLPNKFKIKHFWYNVYHDAQGQEPHTHLNGCMAKNPYWCGIYYNKGSTPTTFLNPNTVNRVHKFPHNSNEFQDIHSDTIKPTITDGDVILFPPYLEHCVELTTSDTMRMTFSFNIFL